MFFQVPLTMALSLKMSMTTTLGCRKWLGAVMLAVVVVTVVMVVVVVLTLTVALLKEQLDKFAVRYPKSGPNSLKQNLQVILTDHLQENEVFVHVGGREGGGGGGGGVSKRWDEELFLEGCVSIKTKVVSVIICCLLGAPRFFPRGHGT